MSKRIITVFGGSGFLGRHVIRKLARKESIIRVAVRKPELAGFLRPLGRVGQIVPIQTNIREKMISDRMRLLGNRMIINTKWIRKENGIDAKDENTIFTNRYDTNMGFYPGAGLPTFNIGLLFFMASIL